MYEIIGIECIHIFDDYYDELMEMIVFNIRELDEFGETYTQHKNIVYDHILDQIRYRNVYGPAQTICTGYNNIVKHICDHSNEEISLRFEQLVFHKTV